MPTSKFTFKYQALPRVDQVTGKQFDVYFPLIPMKLSYNHKIGQSFWALLDSGSDRNLFPAALGIMIGLNVKKGVFKQIMGIGQVTIDAYTHKVDFYIQTRKFSCEVDFSYEQQTPLLGRSGFFDLFKEVSFVEKNKEIRLFCS